MRLLGFEPKRPVWKTDMLAIKHHNRENLQGRIRTYGGKLIRHVNSVLPSTARPLVNTNYSLDSSWLVSVITYSIIPILSRCSLTLTILKPS